MTIRWSTKDSQGKICKKSHSKTGFRDSKQLQSVSVFKDYQFISAARLVVDTIRDAAEMGAIVRNYTLMQQSKQLAEGWQLTLRDVLTSEEVMVKN